MDDLSSISQKQLDDIKVVLTDIDDTLTSDGKLTSDAYVSMERLHDSGYLVIPVTGRCAGWCDHIARMWPVSGIVGENGAFYYRYNHDTKTMISKYCQESVTRRENFVRLHNISKDILSKVSGTALASDQDYRLTDIAIDFAEDVPALPSEKVREIVTIAENAGATAKISSIHVNCWIGSHNKLSTSLNMLDSVFELREPLVQKSVLFVGDSPNDASMFGYFKNSVGVANVMNNLDDLKERPNYVTSQCGGAGFSELADFLLSEKSKTT